MSAAANPLQPTHTPWYRQLWPWLLMAGPAIAVVAGIGTAVIAVRTDDGVVADDYYKRGLEVNKQLRRDELAVALGLNANVVLEDGWLRVRLTGADEPETLKLSLVHPTRDGEDQSVILHRMPDGSAPGLAYGGRFERQGTGLRRIRLEDQQGRWRLSGELLSGASSTTLSTQP